MRREYEHGEGTIKGVARKFGVHRRMVREAIGNAIPPARKIPERERPKLARVIPFIEEMLEADRKAPRKQRHTAHRVWSRLKAEHPEVEIAEARCVVHPRAYPVLDNEYRNGEAQRSAQASASRKKWTLTKRLTPPQLAALRTFYDARKGTHEPFYFYDPYETIPKFSYGPTGVAVTGRYTVRFDSDWSQSLTPGRSDVDVQLIELDVLDLRHGDAAAAEHTCAHAARVFGSSISRLLLKHARTTENPALRRRPARES